MEALELTVSPDYVHSWTTLAALRELVANGLDGQERGRATGTGEFLMEYSARSKVLRLVNRNTIVPASAWVYGVSGSRADTSCIGQFGDGMPTAAIVLLRAGHNVTYWSGDQQWTPEVGPSETFEGIQLLQIRRRKVKERSDFTVEITGISPSQHEEIRQLFLQMDERYDPQAIVQTGKWSRDSVLLQPEYRGCVYVKGVFVQKRPEVKFGYNLWDVEMNRDRTVINDWDLRWHLEIVLQKAVDNDPAGFAEFILPSLFGDEESLESRDDYQHLSGNTAFADQVIEHWDKQFGMTCLAVKNIDEVEAARRLGLKAVVANPLVRKVVNRRYGCLADRESEQEVEVTQTYETWSLTQPESDAWKQAFNLACQVAPTFKEMPLKIASFYGSNVRYHEKNGEYFISRSLLADERSAFKAVAHALSIWESSSKSASLDASADALARMLVQQMKNGRDVIDVAALRRLILQGGGEM
jgi:hypothetical protein